MSVSLPGTLAVIERKGSRGTFSVGELTTSIGVFSVKNRVLDQFPAGSYSGDFIITNITNHSNFSKGRIWVNMYAELDWNQLEVLAESHLSEVPDSLKVASMIDEDEAPEPVIPAAAPTSQSPDPQPKAAVQQPAAQTAPVAEPFAQAEDELIDSLDKLKVAIGNHQALIKLDPSVDRDVFRECRTFVKSSGYSFDAQSLAWKVHK